MPRKQILLVGPDPGKGVDGGVAAHMKSLLALDLFRHAQVFDPGSVNGRFKAKGLGVAAECFLGGPLASPAGFDQIFINVSIYPGSVLKLMFLLAGFDCTALNPRPRARIFFHGGRFQDIRLFRNKTVRQVARKLLGKADAFHFLSSVQAKGFKGLFPDLKTYLYRNFPLSDTLVSGPPEKRDTLLFAGRLVKEKGVYDLASALAGLHAKGVLADRRVLFAGSGPETGRLRAFFRAKGMANVSVPGHLDPGEMARAYASARFLVLPSYKEAMPYAILEGLQTGLPVVATPTGAIPDIIRHGRNGLLVPRHSPDDLSRAMEKLFRDDDLCRRMGKDNRTLYADRFSRASARVFYRKLLAEGPVKTFGGPT